MKKKALEDLLANASFVRWIRGEAVPEEKRYWDTWLRKDSGREQIVDEARSVLDAYRLQGTDIPDTQIEWLKLEHALDKEEQESKVLQLRSGRHHFTRRKRVAAAVILLIGICLGAFFAYQNQFIQQETEVVSADGTHSQEYRTDYGEKVTFRLSDNSRIVLNANSHIRFSTDKDGGFDTKEVWLEGEAYFDIINHSGKSERTFTVFTDDGSVSVLGTRFAVKTMEGETRAVLEEGEVMVELPAESAESALKNETRVILKPGDMAMFSAGLENITVNQVNPRVYTSWNEDIWVFDDTPVADIAGRIEDTFGLDVDVHNELRERRLSGSIKSTNLNVLTEALSVILDAPIRQVNQTTINIGKDE